MAWTRLVLRQPPSPPRSGIHRGRPCLRPHSGWAQPLPCQDLLGKGTPLMLQGNHEHRSQTQQWPSAALRAAGSQMDPQCFSAALLCNCLASGRLPGALGQGRTHCPLHIPPRLPPVLHPVVPGILRGRELWAQLPAGAGRLAGSSSGGPSTHTQSRGRGQRLGARAVWAGGGDSSVWSGPSINRTPISTPPHAPLWDRPPGAWLWEVSGRHTPNACPPITQLSPNAFTSSGLRCETADNPREAMDTPPRKRTTDTPHPPHIHTHSHSHSDTWT